MHIDRLKALIRLANNNPSDNEANAAARRVCKLLAENNFALLNGHKTAAGKVNETHSKEPFWETGDPFYDFFVRYAKQGGPKRSYDEETNKWKGPFRPSESQKKYWTDSAPHQYAPEEPMDPPRRNKQEDFDWVTGKRKRKQELRVCSKCGLETMTFRTDEVPWICNPCHWKDKL